MGSPYLVHHLLASKTDSLSANLKAQIQMEEPQFRWLLHHGAMWVNFHRVLEDVSVEAGQYLRIHMEPRRFPANQIDWRKTILSETDDFLIVRKPQGIPVHATVDNRVENVIFSLEQALGHPLYVTQRLDTPTEGLLVLAKTKTFQSRFNTLLRERKVKKFYRALIERPVPEGEHVHFMKNSPHGPKELSTHGHPGWFECRLIVLSCNKAENHWSAEIELLTGRTHQIRAQMSALGAPIVGDRLYGSTLANPNVPTEYETSDSIPLLACRVAFEDLRVPYDFSI